MSHRDKQTDRVFFLYSVSVDRPHIVVVIVVVVVTSPSGSAYMGGADALKR